MASVISDQCPVEWHLRCFSPSTGLKGLGHLLQIVSIVGIVVCLREALGGAEITKAQDSGADRYGLMSESYR